MHVSRRMMRRCHAMSYREIMRSSTCRALIKQDLAASERSHRHSKHRHSAKRHQARTRHHSARHHKR
jgi:hypothetical protein